MAVERPLNILLLCNRPVRNADASTVTDHLDAFRRFSRHRFRELSFLRRLPSALDLGQFDVLVIHYSIAIGYLSEHYISPAAKQRVRDFPGLKVAFIQDEYRAIDAVIEALRFMRIDLLFTCVPDGEIEKVYPEAMLPGLAKINNLTGYVPEGLLETGTAPIAARPIDVGYRTRKPPYWLGELSYEKWSISDRFEEYALGAGLRLDLSYRESDRIYGKAWVEFMSRCKAMLGVESGASVFDFDGTLQRQVDEYVAAHPDAGFRDVQKKFLGPYEGLIRLNQISPRCFECAALGTVMVLYEGEYSGVLTPWRHYIPLRKDFSNIGEVLGVLKDNARLQVIADCARGEIGRNPAYSFRGFIARFDDAVDGEYARRDLRPAARPYAPGRYWLQIAFSPLYVAHRISSAIFQYVLLGTPIRALLFGVWSRVPLNTRDAIRPLLRLLGR